LDLDDAGVELDEVEIPSDLPYNMAMERFEDDVAQTRRQEPSNAVSEGRLYPGHDTNDTQIEIRPLGPDEIFTQENDAVQEDLVNHFPTNMYTSCNDNILLSTNLSKESRHENCQSIIRKKARPLQEAETSFARLAISHVQAQSMLV
jgi:hypothetical protein